MLLNISSSDVPLKTEVKPTATDSKEVSTEMTDYHEKEVINIVGKQSNDVTSHDSTKISKPSANYCERKPDTTITNSKQVTMIKKSIDPVNLPYNTDDEARSPEAEVSSDNEVQSPKEANILHSGEDENPKDLDTDLEDVPENLLATETAFVIDGFIPGQDMPEDSSLLLDVRS